MYAVIFGNNNKISLLEFFSVFRDKLEILSEVITVENKFIVFNVNNEAEIENAFKELAGAIRLVKIEETTQYSLPFLETLPTIFDKRFNYAISSVGIDSDEKNIVFEYLKSKLKEDGFKANYKNEGNKFPSPNKYFSWNLEKGFEYVILRNEDTYYGGFSILAANTDELREFDIDRPARRFTHGTSPKLVKMMVNILNPLENEKVVDPFCGTGTFLLELIRKNIDVVGIDNDPELINDTERNIEWAQDVFETDSDIQIIEGDSQNTDFLADHCIFEPYMGPFLRSIPTKRQAEDIAKDLEKLYSNVFKNLNKNLVGNGKVVCILPSIPFQGGEFIEISNSVFSKNNFRLQVLPKEVSEVMSNPIPYTPSAKSLIGRKLYLLEKRNF